jgi:hypothetical protein
MTINVTNVRKGLKDVIATQCPGVMVYEYEPDSIVVPCVIVESPDLLDYWFTFGGQTKRLEHLELKLTVIAQRVVAQAAPEVLEQLVCSDSPTSIVAAIEGSNLNGTLSTSTPGGTCHVARAENFGQIQMNDIAYWSCDLHLEMNG